MMSQWNKSTMKQILVSKPDGRLKLNINKTEWRTWMEMNYLETESKINLQQRLRSQ